jgi:hypothetical protein
MEEETKVEATETEEAQSAAVEAEEKKTADAETEEIKAEAPAAEEAQAGEEKAEEPEAQEAAAAAKKEESVKETVEPAKETAEPEKPLDKMTATELRELAREAHGVQGTHAMKKQELLAIIKEARGIKDEELAKKIAKEIDVKALKEKIARLKVEKAVAQEAKDKQKVDIIRRRINRLKKQTRKAA